MKKPEWMSDLLWRQIAFPQPSFSEQNAQVQSMSGPGSDILKAMIPAAQAFNRDIVNHRKPEMMSEGMWSDFQEQNAQAFDEEKRAQQWAREKAAEAQRRSDLLKQLEGLTDRDIPSPLLQILRGRY